MAAINSGLGSPESLVGQRFCQKMLWLICPPPLNFRAPCNPITVEASPKKFVWLYAHNSGRSIWFQIQEPDDISLLVSASLLTVILVKMSITFGHSFGQLFFSNVVIVNVSLMMFRMVKLHNFSRNYRFQSIVIIGQIWQSCFILDWSDSCSQWSKQLCGSKMTKWQHFSESISREKMHEIKIKIGNNLFFCLKMADVWSGWVRD